ncbi:hypothetical protein [Sphaerisporangium corydalis]|uniref:Uncharacterized protein n=1 Tax=Sphaerisporangium corydalis TaxID=1441875 RepID=A0ABV9EKX4_9ACTN|nr:hypothetical protein [Sphaerisporangium corydalis]
MSRRWAVDAAEAASVVPATGDEAAWWRVRGWAEVALGCVHLGSAEAFDGLDEVVLAARVRYAGPHAARLRALRALCGPVPPDYPHTGPVLPGYPHASSVPPGYPHTASMPPGYPHAGPVPSGYPDAGPAGRVPVPSPVTWDLCRALGAFCDAVAEACPGEPSREGSPAPAEEDLHWGERHRPSPRGSYTVARLDRCTGLAGRTWMRLPPLPPAHPPAVRPRPPANAPTVLPCASVHPPAHPLAVPSRPPAHPLAVPSIPVVDSESPHVHTLVSRTVDPPAGVHSVPLRGLSADVLLEVPRVAAPSQERVWRGIHEGAHLDHLAVTTAPIEFGEGLLAAESYAMAVEILATVTCLLEGDLAEARWLRAGLVERIGRIPGYAGWLRGAGEVPAALREAGTWRRTDFAALPRLAETYVRGPLALLAGYDPGPLVPASLTGPLLARWSDACAAFPPAQRLTAEAASRQPAHDGGLAYAGEGHG